MRDLDAITEDNRNGYVHAQPMTLIGVGDQLASAVFALEELAKENPLFASDLQMALRAANAWVCAVIDERAEDCAPTPSTPTSSRQHKEQG